ncbi:ABC transporter substrate-binding protein [Rubellimicrobium aerolatum]|uniref:ABC transporter substrate-binding protein n=1 Tax=Rubellimicrobium aerolatum TaxID=490979 RepID=A0ABW0SGS3_9RHOB|nr:extracellular solute-binding protein [Rubellimicrobium aerolatum]MBP1807391.1 putative spermidine/putrescine transport system substrate-binding protein [Rubellimicrobium aerolatum]
MRSTIWMAGAAAALLAGAAGAQDAAVDLDALYAAAQEEGMLTTIALPHDWCNYGAMIEGFKAKFPGIEVNELNPNGSSADELEAVRANRDNTGPQAPDVLDVGLSFGPAAQEEGLVQPYKVSVWDSIPEGAKDPDGHWYGDYYGVTSFVVNTDLVDPVPASFADLLKPDYAGMVALAGDPRTANNAAMAVMAAGIARGGEPGAGTAEAGLQFFKEMNEAGNFVPVDASSGSLAQGTTPIVVDWDYNGLSTRDQMAGNPPVEVVVPSDGLVAGVYVQAISAYAPHPNAAKLWMEYIYSDEGQLHWLSGYCTPIRFTDMVARGVVPQEMLDKLPPAEAYEAAVFPSLEQVTTHSSAVQQGWDTVVGAEIAAE